MKPEPLTPESYAAYGSVIAAGIGAPVPANQGTAKRYNRLGELHNLRPGSATPNLCVFRSSPFTRDIFEIKFLERHSGSTQVFVPMAGGSQRYLVIVGLGEGRPDPSTIRAFLASTSQGITYHPGVWHHPLIALDRETDFACVVYEDGSSGDCEVKPIEPMIRVPL